MGHGLQTTRHTHDRRLAVDECANWSCYTYYETSTRTELGVIHLSKLFICMTTVAESASHSAGASSRLAYS